MLNASSWARACGNQAERASVVRPTLLGTKQLQHSQQSAPCQLTSSICFARRLAATHCGWQGLSRWLVAITMGTPATITCE